MAMATSSSSFSNPSPIVTYDFTCTASEGVLNLWQENNNFLGSLMSPNPGDFECDETNGIRTNHSGALMETNQSITALVHHFEQIQATGLTLELWFAPNLVDDTSLVQPLLTIGVSQEFSPTTLVGCDGYELQVAQHGNFIQFSFADDDPAQSCRVLLLRDQPLVSQNLIQLVVVQQSG